MNGTRNYDAAVIVAGQGGEHRTGARRRGRPDSERGVAERLITTHGRDENMSNSGAAEAPDEPSYCLITRRDATGADVLSLKYPGGETVLPVFSRGAEAGMFLWLEALGEGWRVEKFSREEFVSLLHDLRTNVERVVQDPFSAKGSEGGLATVDREDFLRTLAGAQVSGREAAHTPEPGAPRPGALRERGTNFREGGRADRRQRRHPGDQRRMEGVEDT